LGAAAFHHRGIGQIADIGRAYELLTPVLGASLASTLFAWRCFAPDKTPR